MKDKELKKLVEKVNNAYPEVAKIAQECPYPWWQVLSDDFLQF